MSVIRVAVVGAGYWGPNIIRNIMQNPHCELVAVCDQDAGCLSRIASLVSKTTALVSDYQEVLNNPAIDAVAIVTGIRSHYELAQKALNAGKHVFVEKPLATTPEECLALGKLADSKERTLMVGHTFIYNPAVVKLKSIMESGELGDVYYLHAQRLNLGRVQTNINSMWSLGVHDVAITLHLFDERPSEVRCWGTGFITPGIEDVTFLNLTFPSGRLANIHVSWLDPEKKRQVTVVGNRKMAVYDDVSLDRKITLYDKGVKGLENRPLEELNQVEYKDFSGFQYLTRSGDVSIPHLDFQEPLKIEIQHFVDCIRGDVKTPTTGWVQGYEVVQVLEAAETSLKQGGVPITMSWESTPKPTPVLSKSGENKR